MATRVVEGKKPYTGGKAISIDENKVISLNLRDENNLIIYDEGDDEIYVDLQLDDEITPTDAFPIGVNVGRVIVDNGWDLPGTIISAVTTSGDNIKIFYADVGTLWIDNGTGTFKQIYFKADVDALLLALRNYIDGELAKKQNGVSSDTAPSDPSEGDLWYDTTNDELKVYDGSQWTGIGGGDVLVSDQANNIFTPGMKIWGGTESDYQSLTPDSNTAYLLLAGGPTPPTPRQPGANTVVYYEFNNNLNDSSGNGYNLTNDSTTFVTLTSGKKVLSVEQASAYNNSFTYDLSSKDFTISLYVKDTAQRSGYDDYQYLMLYNSSNSELIQIKHAGPSQGNNVWGRITDNFSNDVSWYNTDENWHNYFLVYTNTDKIQKLYIDGSLVDTSSAMSNPISVACAKLLLGGLGYGGQAHFQIGDFILEDKARTAQEISDYFDQTKGDYGIS